LNLTLPRGAPPAATASSSAEIHSDGDRPRRTRRSELVVRF